MRRHRSTPCSRRVGGLVLVIVLAGGSVLGACGTSPDSLSLKAGSVSACYRGLPTARTALHETAAKFKGVHRMQIDKLASTFPGLTLPPGEDDAEVCTFAFEGKFVPGQVNGAPAAAQGPYAIVVVSSKHLTLVTSYVGERPPKPDDHRQTGT